MNDPIRNAKLLWIARICLLCAICGASVLVMISLSGSNIAGCGPGSGCDRVLSSEWAYWLTFPVSVPALISYLLLLILTTVSESRPLNVQRLSRMLTVALSFISLGAAFWFVLLQIAVIKAFCKFCLAAHLSASTASILLLFEACRFTSVPATPLTARFHRQDWIRSVLGALLGLAVLIAGQVAVKKRLFAISPLKARSVLSASRLSFHTGTFSLDPKEVPVLGSATATNFVVALFDYTCSHCRDLHPILKKSAELYGNRLAIIVLPVPLDANCNPLILVTATANEDACKYARIALAVWHAKPSVFVEFDNWLFTPLVRPTIQATRDKAEALIGKQLLEQTLRTAWVDRQLQTDVSLYQANARVIEDARLPQLMIGDIITHGAVTSQEDLTHLIEEHLHLKADQSTAELRP